MLLTTAGDETPNIMTFGFHMMVRHAPPLVACMTGAGHHSRETLNATGECVIAGPGVDLATKVVDIGNCSGRDVDKFDESRLTPRPAETVAAPLIQECLANIECRIVDITLDHKYDMLILEP